MNEIEVVEVSLTSGLGVVVKPAVLGVVVENLAEDVRNEVVLAPISFATLKLKIRAKEIRDNFIKARNKRGIGMDKELDLDSRCFVQMHPGTFKTKFRAISRRAGSDGNRHH